MEHFCRKASRVGVVPGTMITIKNIWALLEPMELVMTKLEGRFAMAEDAEC